VISRFVFDQTEKESPDLRKSWKVFIGLACSGESNFNQTTRNWNIYQAKKCTGNFNQSVSKNKD